MMLVRVKVILYALPFFFRQVLTSVGKITGPDILLQIFNHNKRDGLPDIWQLAIQIVRSRVGWCLPY